MPADPVFPVVPHVPGAPSEPPQDRFLGVLMLQTRFPRPPGDIGHPQSFGIPTRHFVVEGAVAAKVVQDAAGLRASGLLDLFVTAAQRLAGDGALAITTSCGFLVLFQRELQSAVPVPLVTSSLVMLPALLRERAQVGVLTISAQRLGAEYLEAAGVPAGRQRDVIVEGMPPDTEFARVIFGDRPRMDAVNVQREVVAAAQRLKARAPGLDTLVLECTNLPPYAAAIEAATGLRTYCLLQCGTLLRPFAAGA